MLTVKEVVERLRLSRAEVYQLIRQGKIHHYRVGVNAGRILVEEADLKAYLDSCRVTSASGEAEMALRHFEPAGSPPAPSGPHPGAAKRSRKHSDAGAS